MKIYLIRHAEALHNVNRDYSIFDPALTDKGYKQCLEIRDKFKGIEKVICSTAVRALQTASTLFPDKKIYATDLLLEYNTGIPCNSRNDLTKQKEHFPHVDFDAYKVKELPKETHWGDGDARSHQFHFILKLLGHGTIAIVSHCNFIRNLAPILGYKHDPKLNNCEYLKIKL